VAPDSPAAEAGIKPGDRLISMNGKDVTTLRDAIEKSRSQAADPVMLQLVRGEHSYAVTVRRQSETEYLRKSGWKELESGALVPLDASDAEGKEYLALIRALEANPKRIVVVFPTHYPSNKQLYYPGFEAFVWDHGARVTVGGIEEGPASRAGIRWGDRITAVNGVALHGKSVAELETLLGSPKPAPMALTIVRAGVRRTFSFELAQASTVLRENGHQVVNGKIVPLWVSEKYLPCFE
jgi:C-terminal processing protease CtpA/Prc